MIRFVFNFIFFGVLFFAIHHYYPDVFEKLVDWAEKIYQFIVDAVYKIIGWVNENTKPDGASSPTKTEISSIYEMLKLWLQ